MPKVTRTCKRCGVATEIERAQLKHGRGKYCSPTCSTAAARERRWATYWAGFEAEFWARVDQLAGPTDCWPYTGTTRPNGYGRFRLKGRWELAHRAAYRFAKGEIKDGRFVCHHCDNPICCNPTHLFIGTHQDNMDDCLKKGRRRGAPKKIDRDRLKALKAKGLNNADIAAEMGVHQTSVARAFAALRARAAADQPQTAQGE